jgi:exodeoxyribonuclease V alpha subunit
VVRGIMLFLQEHGVGTARAVRIYKTYGDQAVELVRANPYRLATDIWGIGFETADRLALHLGIERSSPLRARAAVRFVLQECGGAGHVGYPEEAVIAKTIEHTKEEIPREVIVVAIETGKKEDEFVREPGGDEPWLYLKPLFLAENGVARQIVNLCEGSHPLPALEIELALRWVEQKMGIELAPTQRDAIRQSTTQKVLIITGGPGVGKSTIVRGIVEIFAAKGMRCALCAPTGRAARRLGETTGRGAKTIHRLLEFEPGLGGFKRDRQDPLEADLIVVDEASMIDVTLMNRFLQAVPPQACLVLVGDVDQLPSVGPGTVLADLIASRTVPVVRLTEIFRQAGQSWIVHAAHAVNHGKTPESAPPGQGDFYFIEAATPEIVLDRIITLVRERIPGRFGFDPFREVQVLAPIHGSLLGTRNLNAALQEVLNPAGGTEVQRHGSTFRVGDKVLQTQNNYQKEVFNGDIGRIAAIDRTDQEMTVDFEGRSVVYDFGELDELALAYSLSVHKAQGSEYPAVVMPVHTQHFVMLQRNLLYTAVTRGKKVVVLVGNRKALEMAVQRHDTSQRYTALARRLREQDQGETRAEQ